MCSVHNTRNNAILLTPKYPETMVLGMCDSFDYQLLVCCCHKDTPCIVQKVCSGIIICVLYFEYRIIPSCILHSIMHGSPLPSILEVHNCNYFHQKKRVDVIVIKSFWFQLYYILVYSQGEITEGMVIAMREVNRIIVSKLAIQVPYITSLR